MSFSLGLKIINLTLGNAPVAYFKNKALILCQYGDKKKKKKKNTDCLFDEMKLDEFSTVT